jgi:hypothetical protein
VLGECGARFWICACVVLEDVLSFYSHLFEGRLWVNSMPLECSSFPARCLFIRSLLTFHPFEK